MGTGKPPRGGARHRDQSATPAAAPGLGDSLRPAEADTSSPLGGGRAAGELGHAIEPVPETSLDTPVLGTPGVSAYVTAQAGREQPGTSTGGLHEPLALLPEVTDTRSGDIFHTVQDYARRHPAPFLGGAFFLGLGLARFLKSSAARRRGASRRFGRGSAHRDARLVRAPRGAAIQTGQDVYGSTGASLRTPADGARDALGPGRSQARDRSGQAGRS
jgi:hypothetical protein